MCVIELLSFLKLVFALYFFRSYICVLLHSCFVKNPCTSLILLNHMLQFVIIIINNQVNKKKSE
jgi:hypothetical protein